MSRDRMCAHGMPEASTLCAHCYPPANEDDAELREALDSACRENQQLTEEVRAGNQRIEEWRAQAAKLARENEALQKALRSIVACWETPERALWAAAVEMYDTATRALNPAKASET